MFDVCVIGSANLDLVATVERLPGPGETVSGSSYHEYPGGKGLNQAVAASRSGARTVFVGALGNDHAGDLLHAVLVAESIDAALVERVDEPTGRALIGVSTAGENSIVVVAGANAAVSAHALPDAKVVLAQLEVPLEAVEEALALARGRGSTTVLNPAPATTLPPSLLGLCDVIVPNEHEVELLGGPERLLELGAKAVVVTLGPRGASLHTAVGVTAVAPYAVRPVDTTAAGDSFCGALAARLAAGDELIAALAFASAAGALCTTRAGAVPSIPRVDEVRRLLATG